MQRKQDVFRAVHQGGVVAVVTVDREDQGPAIARALLDGGIHAIELTLRTDAALGALGRIVREVPDMIAGMGTLLSPEQVRAASDAGADFGVSPGLNPRVVSAAAECGLPFAPGILTPTDIERALELNCRVMKFFPAEPSGGLPYLKSMSVPYAHLGVRFIPLGGVTMHNLSDYLREPIIQAVGGSWLAPRTAVDKEDWPEITRLAALARRRVDETRAAMPAA